jgi:hypothetical protein
MRFQQKHLCNYLIFSDIAKIIEKVSIFCRGISAEFVNKNQMSIVNVVKKVDSQ